MLSPILVSAMSNSSTQRSRSLLSGILRDTFSRPGARLGMIWTLVIMALAVISPYIANSMPYAVRIDGEWSSPLLRYLTPVDATLTSGAFVALALLPFHRIPRRPVWRGCGIGKPCMLPESRGARYLR